MGLCALPPLPHRQTFVLVESPENNVRLEMQMPLSLKGMRKKQISRILGSAFGRKDLFADFFLSRRNFPGLCRPDCSLRFVVGEECPEKSSKAIPGKVL